MPPSPFQRKPHAHGTQSLLRYLFPHTRQRARARFSQFRHETLGSLKHRTQSRIYRYIVHRQAQKLKNKNGRGILQRLRTQSRKLVGSSSLEDEARRRRQQLTKAAGADAAVRSVMSYQDGYGAREPGARRRKLAGYLKAANELRQTYTQQYTGGGWSSRESAYDYDDDTPGSFPDAAIVRSGDEEMILFPSYARKHIKQKPRAEPGTIQEAPGDGRDVRDSAGAGDAEFWKQQWDSYEDDNAVVDVDVRGWIYSPHKGQMSRKQRLFIGLARQLVGIQAAPAGSKPASSTSSPLSSRDPSPGHTGHNERHKMRQAQRDELLTSKEAEEILRKGEMEAEKAAQGQYSEKPSARDADDPGMYRTRSRDSVLTTRSEMRPDQTPRSTSVSSLRNEESITPLQKRASWNQPADMSPAELAEANARLMARLRHFLAIPMANTPISVFFYNEENSKQRTIYTNPSGHFSICAALDFVPTHVRILASDKLSATEDIIVTEPDGVSVISDIDDTIKHSAISSGAREIFRNAFIRDLGDLTIDGVKEWYSKMAELGVKFHYVSNSPWQLYPVISKYFQMAGLPSGSFHLKQYSGMLQGIFEPVAERKKSTLDKIARDFPERRFILIGDSGEADLEVYTDFVLENPGRVIAVFIRDVTTTEDTRFFDQSMGSRSGPSAPSSPQRGSAHPAGKVATSSAAAEEHDPELKAAIEASIRDMEEDDKRRSKSTFPITDDHPESRPQLPPRRSSPPKAAQHVANLIDLSSDDEKGSDPLPAFRRTNSDAPVQMTHRTSTTSTKSAPPPPRKPIALRSSSSGPPSPDSPSSNSKVPPRPPQPRKSVPIGHQSSPLVQQSSIQSPNNLSSKPQPGPKPTLQPQQTYAGLARDKLSSVYNNLPAWRATENAAEPRQEPLMSIESSSLGRKPPPPPPPRRGITAYPVAAASYVGGKAATAWQNAPTIPHPSTRPNVNPNIAHANSFSTTTSLQQPTRSTASSNGSNSASYAGNVEYPAGMNKREVMWRQRWSRAEGILKEKGVLLRSWRVGSDVMGDAERLIKDSATKENKGAKSGAKR